MGLDIRLATSCSLVQEWTGRRHWDLSGIYACMFSYIYLSPHWSSFWHLIQHRINRIKIC